MNLSTCLTMPEVRSGHRRARLSVRCWQYLFFSRGGLRIELSDVEEEEYSDDQYTVATSQERYS